MYGKYFALLERIYALVRGRYLNECHEWGEMIFSGKRCDWEVNLFEV